MASKKFNYWINPKKPNYAYRGAYTHDFLDGERVFVLFTLLKNGKVHHVSFESHQMAKALGWKKS